MEYPNYKLGEDHEDVRLSDAFLWTFNSPIFKHYPQIKHRTSLFDFLRGSLVSPLVL